MRPALVHQTTHYAQWIKDCRLGGSPNDSTASCIYFSRVNNLAREFISDLDRIGWPEFCEAGADLAATRFEPTLEGAERLKEAVLALCDHLSIMIKRFGRDPSNWRPLGELVLPHIVQRASFQNSRSSILAAPH